MSLGSPAPSVPQFPRLVRRHCGRLPALGRVEAGMRPPLLRPRPRHPGRPFPCGALGVAFGPRWLRLWPPLGGVRRPEDTGRRWRVWSGDAGAGGGAAGERRPRQRGGRRPSRGPSAGPCPPTSRLRPADRAPAVAAWTGLPGSSGRPPFPVGRVAATAGLVGLPEEVMLPLRLKVRGVGRLPESLGLMNK